MSISSRRTSFNGMATPSLRDLKKQASFFFKEKIKTARLALTDVTPAQLMTEEATDGDSWAPNTQLLGSISKAAFDLDEYWRIVEILHNRLAKFEKKKWRVSYNSLLVLEYLLTHGPESVADEFQCDKDAIIQMGSFQHIDEKGFNWGLSVRRKSQKVLKLMEKGPFLKEERNRARELTRGIRGFGSFNHRSSSGGGILQESRREAYGRSNSAFNEHDQQENQPEEPKDTVQKKAQGSRQEASYRIRDGSGSKSRTSSKENTVPKCQDLFQEKAVTANEANPLLGCEKDEQKMEDLKEDDETVVSLLPNGASSVC